MTDLHRALVDIRSLRRQVTESSEFRGYGPLTLSATACFALMAGVVQAWWVPAPAAHPVPYVAVWLATAVLSAALIATQMLARANRLHSGLADEMIRLAVLQFLPAGVAGVLVPLLLLRASPGSVWVIPGMWQVCFSLGVFASCRCLPRPMWLVGVWFLLTGLGCFALGDGRALHPAVMSGAFALGMAQVAAVHVAAARKAALDGE